MAAPAWPLAAVRVSTSTRSRSPSPCAPAPHSTAPQLESFADVVAIAGRDRDLKLKHSLETYVRPIRFEPGQIEMALTEHAPRDLVGELSKKLEEWTGQRWMIAVGRDADARTIEEVRQQRARTPCQRRARRSGRGRRSGAVSRRRDRRCARARRRVRGRAAGVGREPPYINPDEIPDEED